MKANWAARKGQVSAPTVTALLAFVSLGEFPANSASGGCAGIERDECGKRTQGKRQASQNDAADLGADA